MMARLRPQTRSYARVLALLVGGTMLAHAAYADDAHHTNSADQPAATAGEALSKPTGDIRPGLAGSFLSGRFARHQQDLQEAAKYLGETLARDPENEHLQHEAMRANLLAGNTDAAIAFADKLAKDAPIDPLTACLLMLQDVKAGDYKKAQAVIATAPTSGLFGLVRPVMAQWIGIAAGDTKGVIDMQPAIDKAGFFAPFLTYHGALMNDVLGNSAAAAAGYAKASKDPAVTPYRVVQAVANFDERQGKPADAQGIFDAYAKANPDSSLIPDKFPASGETPKPLVGNAQEGIAELFFTTASILFGDQSTQDTFLYLRIALELRPNMPPAQLMLANLYEQNEDYKQAIATYDAIPEGSVFYRRGQVRKALNLEALGQKTEALALLDTLAKRDPKDATALITKGDMLREAENYADAIDAYSEAIRRTEPLTAADWPLLYARGISEERGNNWPAAEADFTRALTLEPNQPDVLNYLAYSWLTMNKNTAKAREYLETALAERPDDPHIIDSIGWARYLAGDFKGSVESFEKAVDLMPDDVTVNNHLGDAYWRTGREIEARYQWERALANKPDKDVEAELHAKLEKGLPPEGSATPAKPAGDKPASVSDGTTAPNPGKMLVQ